MEVVGGGSVLNLAFKSPVVNVSLSLISSFYLSLSVFALYRSSFSLSLSLCIIALHPSLQLRSATSRSRFSSGTTNIAAKWRPFILACRRDSSGIGNEREIQSTGT